MAGRFVSAEGKQFQNGFETVLFRFRFSFISVVRTVLSATKTTDSRKSACARANSWRETGAQSRVTWSWQGRGVCARARVCDVHD